MRPLAFLLCFGSIWTLLGFMWRLAPMHVLGIVLLVPSLLGLVAIHVWARRSDPDLDRDLTLGWWGGLWGTIGYDAIRIPFHLVGMTPFHPIRSYGMFLLDAPHTTVLTDLAGVAYHFSNGLTFGVMYALWMSGRRWGWGVLWGLVLETFAVLTPFGAIYALRSAPPNLALAYFAHLYYGLPLGVAVQDPERLWRWLDRRVRWATAAATLGVVAFLVLAFEPPGALRPPPGTVWLGPERVVAGWTRVGVGEPLVLQNRDDRPIRWSLGDQHGVVPPAGTVTVTSPTAGLFPLRVTDEAGRSPWRLTLISVERDGYPAEPGTW